MSPFEDKVVMLTGAAGSLGQVVARPFLQAKAQLVLVDRAESRLEHLFSELVDNPNHILASGVDLTEEAQVNAMVERAQRQLSRVDILLNIAGMYKGGMSVVETSLEDWQQLNRVNAQSAFLTARAVVPSMKSNQYGKIINIAARPALRAVAGNAAYAASKSAILRLTESLSSELKGFGINVNAVIPGTIDTQANRQSMPNADHDKWVDPAAIADVIYFLCSQSARAIHGAALPVLGLS